MPTAGANAGKIDITYDAFGVAGRTTDVLIDVVGYTTNTGLQQLVADVTLKANAADVYTRAQTDAKFATTGSTTLGAASFTADSAVVNWTNGCLRNSAGSFEVRSAVQLPVGVTITGITGAIIDGNAANSTFTLSRLSGDFVPVIATVTSSGSTSGVFNRSANLATPDLVQPGEYYFVTYSGGDGSSSHQICGASVQYTIATGQSILEEPAQNDVVGVPAGQE